jgi:ribosome-binding factor A
MPSFKMGRTTEDIRRELSAIQRELKDPRVQGMLLSIVRVEVTNDLSYCTVHVSAMEGMEKAQQAVKGLRSASGFIRRELGRRLQLRHVPELIFKATDSIEYSANISRMLHDLEAEGKMTKEPAPSGEECTEDADPKDANG